MAARQDQTLQITLIVFAFLLVVFAALTYLFYKSSSDAEQRIAELENQLGDKQSAVGTLQTEVQNYRQYMGVGEFDNFEDVQSTFQEDMERFGATFDESQRNYHKILESVYTENERITQREAEAKEQLRQLNERLLAVEEQKESQVKIFEAERQKAEEDAAAQRNAFARDRAELESTKQELLESLERARENFQAQLTERDATIESLNETLADNDRALKKLIEERASEDISFELADGSIRWVNQDGTVWINVGAADSLRRQVTFSVYDPDLPDPAAADKKGSIVVTRLIGDHVAEARITSDDPTDPILPGDRIFSQVWDRGEALGFALTGVIDIDGDGRSDLQQAADLIALNGGRMDAYLDEDGTIEGEMTINTRYLVLGEYPNEAIKADIRRGWDEMTEEAKKLGVQTILLSEFLNQMGYTPENRTVVMGAGARSADFSADQSRDVRPGSPATQFRRRTPYRNAISTPY